MSTYGSEGATYETMSTSMQFLDTTPGGDGSTSIVYKIQLRVQSRVQHTSIVLKDIQTKRTRWNWYFNHNSNGNRDKSTQHETYLGNPQLKPYVPQDFTEEQIKSLSSARRPEHFARQYIKIVSVDEGLIPFDVRDYQSEMIQISRNDLSFADQQSGKSTTILTTSLHHL